MKGLKVERIDPYRLMIPRQACMRTHGMVYADATIEKRLYTDEALSQVVNVACLPGILGPSIAMPDIHMGYGFPIGGVAAFSKKDGVVSPGGVGYDINCGIRCVLTNMHLDDILPLKEQILQRIFTKVPSGVGSKHKVLKCTDKEFKDIITQGARWLVKKGLCPDVDLECHEDFGVLPGADPSNISERAKLRGLPELGTLGSGNHFIEMDVVDSIVDKDVAKAFSLFENQVLILIHTGSRGLGHQVCDDYIHAMLRTLPAYGIDLPDRQLACAPLAYDDAHTYLSAMAGAANFAFVNRGMVTHLVRSAFEEVFGRSWESMGMYLLYDCCHNIAKIEEILIHGEHVEACIHRKGATRALPPGDDRLPPRFRHTGQPVIVPGDMGRSSYILTGEEGSQETFYSACHGAGRLMSRHKARKQAKGRSISDELHRKGIYAVAARGFTLAEEMPDAYKDISDVVNTISGAGIARVVARMRPLGMIKG